MAIAQRDYAAMTVGLSFTQHMLIGNKQVPTAHSICFAWGHNAAQSLPAAACTSTTVPDTALASALCCACCPTVQALTDADKVQHCRAVAERGLSDLLAYSNMATTADGGNYSINLKGATG